MREDTARRVWLETLKQSSSFVRSIREEGHRVPLRTQPPVSLCPQAHAGNRKHHDEALRLWEDLASRGIVKEVECISAGHFSPSFAIPKKTPGKFRLISDLRQLNEHVRKTKLKLPGLSKVIPHIRKGDYLLTVDVKDGYFNVKIHADSVHLLRFPIGSKVFQFERLPMGLTTSMSVFRAWMRPIMNTLRKLFPEVMVFDYVDDILFVIPRCTLAKAKQTARDIRTALRAMEVPIAQDKQDWTPSRERDHLGFRLDTRKLRVSIPAKKRRDVLKGIRRALKRDAEDTLRLKHLCSLAGTLVALTPAVEQARLHMRGIFNLQARIVRSKGWSMQQPAKLDLRQKAELRWWLTHLELNPHTPMSGQFRSCELTLLSTDASDEAIAGHLIFPRQETFVRRLRPRELPLSINRKELMAVHESIIGFAPHIKHSHLNIRTDNMTVLSVLNNWASKSVNLIPLVKAIHDLTRELHTCITCTHVPSHSNEVADSLSRGVQPSFKEVAAEKQAHQLPNATIQMKKGPRRALLRALRLKPRLHLPTDLGRTPTAALTSSSRTTGMCVPALNAVPDLLRLCARSAIKVLTVVPAWPGAPWFNDMCRMAVSTPVFLRPSAVKLLHRKSPVRVSWDYIGIVLSASRRRLVSYQKRLQGLQDSRQLRSLVIDGGGGISPHTSRRQNAILARFWGVATRAKH